MWVGFRSMEVLPSPKFQDQEVGSPLEASVNVRVSEQGDFESTRNPAVGPTLQEDRQVRDFLWLTMVAMVVSSHAVLFPRMVGLSSALLLLTCLAPKLCPSSWAWLIMRYDAVLVKSRTTFPPEDLLQTVPT